MGSEMVVMLDYRIVCGILSGMRGLECGHGAWEGFASIGFGLQLFLPSPNEIHDLAITTIRVNCFDVRSQ
jgi:hypothetical protein